jgi:hypothetical protein
MFLDQKLLIHTGETAVKFFSPIVEQHGAVDWKTNRSRLTQPKIAFSGIIVLYANSCRLPVRKANQKLGVRAQIDGIDNHPIQPVPVRGLAMQVRRVVQRHPLGPHNDIRKFPGYLAFAISSRLHSDAAHS